MTELSRRWRLVVLASVLLLTTATVAADGDEEAITPDQAGHFEVPDDPWIRVPPEQRLTAPARRWIQGGHVSIQVNVDEVGNNIVGDAANEPSLAVDPNDPERVVIGWRQFDTIASNFRQAGWAYTDDGGDSWTTSVIDPGLFRSDPVLAADSDGNFYYYSLRINAGFVCDTFKSLDGGATWGDAVFAFGGDKNWISADQSGGIGDGNLYGIWSPGGCCGDQFSRSADGGQSFEKPVLVGGTPIWGVTAVGPEGDVYAFGRSADPSQFSFARSQTIQDPGMPLDFDIEITLNLGGSMSFFDGPNPGGLLGQAWAAAGPAGSNEVYALCSVNPPGADPLDVHFIRSADRGQTWSAPLRINDDPAGTNAWQWFGTMSVAPNGRIDVIWNDTREDPGGFMSELYYSSSSDGGFTWSPGEVLSPAFDPHIGWPQQNKIGDYYHMVSDNVGAHIAYSATFNGEQDVYYMRLLLDVDAIFSDGFESGNISAWSPK